MNIVGGTITILRNDDPLPKVSITDADIILEIDGNSDPIDFINSKVGAGSVISDSHITTLSFRARQIADGAIKKAQEPQPAQNLLARAIRHIWSPS